MLEEPKFKTSFRDKIEAFLYSTPVEIIVYILIILSVVFIGIEASNPEIMKNPYVHEYFEAAEMGFTLFFSIEYVIKLLVAKDKWLFFRQYFIDLLAILPFLRFFRLLRGFRMLRILRVVRLLRLGNMVARRLSKLEGSSKLREIIIILVVFFSTVIAGSIGILEFERPEPISENATAIEQEVWQESYDNAHFKTFEDGLWWCFVTITTVGYGDKYPQTAAGRILGGLIMLVGLSFYGLVAGLGSTFIISRLKKGNEWMVSTFSNHAIILGVNNKLPRIVEILLDRNQRVAIVTENVDRVPQYPEHLVAVIEGDFLLESILIKAKIDMATNVIILADTHNRKPSDADARSVLAALTVEKVRPEVDTVVEAISADTVFHLENAKVDTIIQSGALTSEMLAYSADYPKYSHHLHTLLRFVYKNNVLLAPVPSDFWGKELHEIQLMFVPDKKVVLGINRDNNEILDTSIILQEGDQFISIEIL